ncbi:MAG: fibrobacter succinogenes major paralogous domain-containing protein [Bacteroidales bacterium]|nr:fibrobacter succinogenes major paralogous domain-containing protein [Bacteroidales bacterium]
MEFKRFAIIALVCGFAAAASTGCKDKDDDTEYFYLNGELRFEYQPYVEQNARVVFVPKGVTHPDGEDIGYVWKVSSLMSSYDTTKFVGEKGDGSFQFDFTDSLGSFTVSCYAYADGYVSSSASRSVTVVDPSLNGSLTNTGVGGAGESREVDPRDGKTIYYRTHNGVDWMSSNLAYMNSGIPYANCGCMSDIFGRLYSWEEAQNVCPTGWTLPSDADFQAFGAQYGCSYDSVSGKILGFAGKLMVNSYFNTLKMWEFWPEVKITNETGFAAIPVGYANLGNNGFNGTTEYACFWTSDTTQSEGETFGVYRYIVNSEVGNPDVLKGKADKKAFGASVRCIRKK